MQDTARSGKAAGLSPLELARQTDLGRFAELTDSERIVGNLYRAYAELDGAAPGAPIDVIGGTCATWSPTTAASHCAVWLSEV